MISQNSLQLIIGLLILGLSTGCNTQDPERTPVPPTNVVAEIPPSSTAETIPQTATPASSPSATTAPPTDTATFTPMPTAANTTTSTPTATATPSPTYTPLATATLPPPPTNTPGPTHTPQPTNTPAPPTNTPVPPMPDVLILSPLELRDGPGWSYAVVGQAAVEQSPQPIGQYSNCAWLQVRTPDQVAGWAPNDGTGMQLNQPCETIPDGIFRPFTSLIRNTQGDGMGELGISNQSSNDGVVVLATQDNQTVVSAYIRNGDSFRMTGIHDGTYVIFFSTGSNWNGNQARFTAGVSNQRFDNTLSYTSSDGSYTIWEITLHGVAGGTASTSSVTDIPRP